MSSYQDNKTNGISANTGDVSKQFNLENALADKINAASAKTQEKIKERLELAAERREKEQRSQKFNRKSRVAREENRLLKQYVQAEVDRPNTPEAKAQDMKIIEQDAERRVTDRESYYLSQIEKQSESDVRHMLSKDRQQSRSQDQQHNDQEHER